MVDRARELEQGTRERRPIGWDGRSAKEMLEEAERAFAEHQALRDMRNSRVFEGSTEIMHLLIAREAVDQHLQVAGDILDAGTDLKAKARGAAKAGAFYAKWLPQLAVGEGQRPGAFDEFGPLAGHLRFVERAARKQARATFYGMGRWQAKMEYKQSFLGRIVDIGAELFAMASAVVYAGTIGAEHPERAEQATELADLFCRQARRRVDALFTALWANDDDDYRAAQQVLGGRYAWLEDGVPDPSEARVAAPAPSG